MIRLLAHTNQSMSHKGVCCKSTVDSLGSRQSLDYELFLWTWLCTCAEASSVEKTALDMENDVSVDLVSSSYCGVRSKK